MRRRVVLSAMTAATVASLGTTGARSSDGSRRFLSVLKNPASGVSTLGGQLIETKRPWFGVTVEPNDLTAIDSFKELTGKQPKVLQIEIPPTQRKTPAVYDRSLRIAKDHVNAGGSIMLCHHSGNPWVSDDMVPVVGRQRINRGSGNSWDDISVKTALSSLIGGGVNRVKWLLYLDYVASWINLLKTPVIWRPFHEVNGDWFWWGGLHNASVFKEVWGDLVGEMSRRTDNVLFCLNFSGTSDPKSPLHPSVASYSNWYLGADYVDCFSFDYYSAGGRYSDATVLDCWRSLRNLARPDGKISLVSEFGGNYSKSAQIIPQYWNSALVDLKNDYEGLAAAVTWAAPCAPAVHVPSSSGFLEQINEARWQFFS